MNLGGVVSLRRLIHLVLLGTFAVTLLVGSLPAIAQTNESSDNMTLLFNSPRPTTATQTDLAFKGRFVFAGTSTGFRILEYSPGNQGRQLVHFLCNGSQGDVSVYKNLLFRSVDSPQSNATCNSTNVTGSTPGMFEGIQIFDISDPSNPVHVNSVPTDCGSHTHTLVPDPANNRVFIYVSSYPLGGGALGPTCQPLATPGGGHGKISIVEVPLNNPLAATVSPYFLDEDTEVGDYLGFQFTACHDISVFVELDLAAAACLTEGQVWDISNPAEPEFLYRYDNPNIKPENIDLFHSSAFSWDGSIIAFGDESGGGGAARCVDPEDNQGRVWFIDTETGEDLASFKPPRSITTTCTMHNFNFVPNKAGNNVLVSSAYTGGTTVVDVDALIGGATEAEAEIGYAIPEGNNTWSSYWYNGFIYANGVRGLDVFKLTDDRVQKDIKLPYMNPQTQEKVLH
jgi:hypothetical protein